MSILLSVSGTYPYYAGGVSTWTDQLLVGLSEHRFELISIVSNPDVTLRFSPPGNVGRMTTIPLWGAGRPEEFRDSSMLAMVSRHRRTSHREVERGLVPHYQAFLLEILAGGRDVRRLAEALLGMAKFFKRHDFYTALRSPPTWEVFVRTLADHPLFCRMPMIDAIRLCQRLERLLRVVGYWPRPVALAHAAVAGVAGIPAVLTKLVHGTPYLLTEHGVYYRERLLDLMNEQGSPLLRAFLRNLEHALVRLNYTFADLITPVCEFNARWERTLGVRPEKLRVIYNGVDTARFAPREAAADQTPYIVSLTRLDPLKDTLNLIEAMAHVNPVMPSVRCLIYGDGGDSAYRRLCAQRATSLGLEGVVLFCGLTHDPVGAYSRGDVVVSPSLSEGFPFGVIEAMACGRMVVATDVGGVREALQDCGALVPPRAPRRLGDALIQALRDPARREELGRRARERVLRYYQLPAMLDAYRDVYADLVRRSRAAA